MRRKIIALLGAAWLVVCAAVCSNPAESFGPVGPEVPVEPAEKPGVPEEPESNGSGTGEEEAGGPRKISTQAELAGIGPDGDWVLAADITISGDWTPIGDAASPFTGTFDGAGHKITWAGTVLKPVNVKDYNRGGGIFGVVGTGGIVKNLLVSGSLSWRNERSAQFFLAHVAAINRGLIANCGTSGSLSLSQTKTQNAYAGGVAARNYEDGVIRNCHSQGSVTIAASGIDLYYAGGIAASSAGEVTHCFAMGRVSTPILEGNYYTGGIIGVVWSATASVSQCAALHANLTGTDSNTYRVAASFLKDAILENNCGLATINKNGGSFQWEESPKNGESVRPEEVWTEAWWTAPERWGPVWGADEAAPWQWDAVKGRPRLWFE